MIKTLVKIASGAVLVASITANAASFNQVISSPLITNVTTILPTSASASQFVLTSGAANAASVTIYDGWTNSLTYTNGAYSYISSYATNAWISYTNYYGRTNYLTNTWLVDITNTVSGTTNSFPVIGTFSSPTNQSTTFTINAKFQNGIWVTNATVGGGTITLSGTYTQ